MYLVPVTQKTGYCPEPLNPKGMVFKGFRGGTWDARPCRGDAEMFEGCVLRGHLSWP